MSKTATIIGMVVVLQIIVGISLFIRNNTTSVQKLPSETYSATTDTSGNYYNPNSNNTAMLTESVR